MTATPTEPAGVIHDIGFRHYDGPRLGRRHATVALTRHSLRGLFGVGRTARSKIMPFLLVTVMLLPAVVSIAVMTLAQERTVVYAGYALILQPVLALFLASQSPYLVAMDLRFRVLPLYLSRPVTVSDYIGAKLAAMTAALFLLLAVPLTLMYAGELVVDLPGPPFTGDYLAALVTAMVYAMLLAGLGTAIASLTPRRGLAVASVIALYLLSSTVSSVLTGAMIGLNQEETAEWTLLINPFFMVDAVHCWVFGQEPALGNTYPDGIGGPVAALGVLALMASSLWLLVLRYRKASSA